jgi:electron transfer flavoprotein alpha subunit
MVGAETINSIFLHSIDGMEDNCYFDVSDEIKNFVQNNSQYTHVVMGNGLLPKEILPRLACAFNSQCISDVISILDSHRFQRPVYAGNAISTVRAVLKNESGNLYLQYYGVDRWIKPNYLLLYIHNITNTLID